MMSFFFPNNFLTCVVGGRNVFCNTPKYTAILTYKNVFELGELNLIGL